MLRPSGLLVSSCLIALTAGAAVEAPPGSAWTNVPPRSVYSRALGPPMATMNTIKVPFMPKTSPFFPKFVDPKSMISKKTDMLSNMFSGQGPAAFLPGFNPYSAFAFGGPSTYDGADKSFEKPQFEDGSGGYKRGMFGPFPSKMGPGPFGPKFAGPKFLGPKFGGMSQLPEFESMAEYGTGTNSFSRKRRSLEDDKSLRSLLDTGKPSTKDLLGPPPAYPSLAPISEEQPEEESNSLLLDKPSSPVAPKQYLPGLFGPSFGPFGPFAPVVDPTMFISKKSAFLDTLFKNIATSTAAPAFTEAPTAKSTIVPGSFWYPSSIVPGPTEYADKVSSFLEKLFENLKINKTAAGSTTPKGDSYPEGGYYAEARISRSVEDLSSISTAKDSIVEAILSELGDVKGDMMTTMNDLIAYEKATAVLASPKKPFKPFGPGSMWSKPTVDPTFPFQQRMTMLGQVFDMLTDLQKNITLAMQSAMKADKPVAASSYPFDFEQSSEDFYDSNLPINMSLLDAVKSRLAALNSPSSTGYVATPTKFGPKNLRTLSKAPSSFWVSYPESTASPAKREVDQESFEANGRQEARGVQMQMHQGYQSLPAGSIESVQAGGGSTPGHQGGGIKLLDSGSYGDTDNWVDWMDYSRNENQGRRHHNHH